MEIKRNALAQFKKSSPCQGTCKWQGMSTRIIKRGIIGIYRLSNFHVPDSKLSDEENFDEKDISLCWYTTW